MAPTPGIALTRSVLRSLSATFGEHVWIVEACSMAASTAYCMASFGHAEVILNLGDLLHVLDVLSDDVADAPTGHGEGLGERIHDENPVVACAEDNVLTFEDDAVIHLVADDPQVAWGELEQGVTLCCIDGSACWIGEKL